MWRTSPRLQVLGTIALVVDGHETPVSGKAGQVLAVLVAEPDGVAFEALADRLWPEQLPGTYRAALHVHLSALRRRLAECADAPTIERIGDRYVLRREGWLTDVDIVIDGTALAGSLLDHDPAGARRVITEVLALWRGAAYVDHGRSVVPVSTRGVAAARLDAEELEVEAALALGDHGAAEGLALRLVESEPYRERRWGQLLRARYAAGRTADALRTYGAARSILVDQLGVEPGDELRRLERAVLTHDRDALGLGAPNADASAIEPSVEHSVASHSFDPPPPPKWPLVGRQAELARVSMCLAVGTPVIVLGAPGVGKTRFAAEVGQAAVDAGRPVAWIDLRNAPYERSTSLLADLDPWARRHPGGLVILDNAETVAVDVVRTVDGLLRAVPSLQVLVTSRVAVSIEGAVELLAPLGEAPAAVLLRMFLERFAPDTHMDTSQVERICATVGGLPLGLRLAASTAHALSATSLAQHPAPEFSAELDRAVASILDLLPPDRRAAFGAMSVVAGQLDHELAMALVGDDHTSAGAIVVDLVGAGLVQFTPASRQPYSVLEPIRSIGLLQLERSGDRGPVLRRLVDHHIDAARALAATVGPEPDVVADVLRRRFARFRQVIDLAAELGDADAALSIVCHLESPLYTLGWWPQRRVMADAALAIPGPPSAMRARALAFRGRAGPISWFSEDDLTTAIEMAAAAHATSIEYVALHLMGVLRWWQGRHVEAIELQARAADHFAATGVALLHREARKFQGVAMVFAGQHGEGLALQRDVMLELRRAGDSDALLAHGLAYLGHCRRHLGDRTAAWADLTEAATIWQRLGNQGSSIHVLAGLSELAIEADDPSTALIHARDGLSVSSRADLHVYEAWLWTLVARAHHALGDEVSMALAAERAVGALSTTADGEQSRVAGALATIACDLDDPVSAARLLGVAAAVDGRRELPFVDPAELTRLDVLAKRVRSSIGTQAFDLVDSGRTSTVAEAVAALVRRAGAVIDTSADPNVIVPERRRTGSWS